jgi:hypothetical protein
MAGVRCQCFLFLLSSRLALTANLFKGQFVLPKEKGQERQSGKTTTLLKKRLIRNTKLSF